MKKSFFFAALILMAAVFTGCTSNSDRYNDSTKLWIACDADGKNWGYIDNTGAMIVPTMYKEAKAFSCGLARVRMGDSYYFLDKKGKTVQGATDLSNGCDAYFYYNYCGFKIKSGLWGMMDKDLKTVIQPAYRYLGQMSDEGLVAACLDGADKRGYINTKGEWVINPMYDVASMFEDGVAVVKAGDKFGAIDTKGQYKVNSMYDFLTSLGEGRLAFSNDNKTNKKGMMDTKGNVITQPMYDNITGFADNDLCPVCQDDKWGYINKSGDIKLPISYTYAGPFYEGYAWIMRSKGGNYELIDTNGQTIITLSDKEIPASVFHNGLCRVFTRGEKNNSYKYIDMKGTMIYQWTTNDYYPFTEDEDNYNNWGDDDWGDDDGGDDDWGDDDWYAPARVASEKKLNTAKMFAGTPYGARFNKK